MKCVKEKCPFYMDQYLVNYGRQIKVCNAECKEVEECCLKDAMLVASSKKLENMRKALPIIEDNQPEQAE